MDCSSTAPLENDSSLNGSLDTQRGWRAALSLLGGSIICQARSRRRAMWCFTILRLAVPFTSSIHARVLFDAIVLTGREYGNIGRTAHAFSTPRHFLSPSRTSASPMLVVRILSFSTREREREGLCTSACHSSRTIARRRRGSHERFTLYSSNDGAHSNMKISRIEITTRGSQIIHGISFFTRGNRGTPPPQRSSVDLSFRSVVSMRLWNCGIAYRCVGLFYEEEDAERRL